MLHRLYLKGVFAMEQELKQDEKYERARKRVAELKGFYGHFAIYSGTMLLLFCIDFLTGGGWWFYWPLLGWGIGVLAHAISVFGIDGIFGSEWEEKKIRELMSKR
jgi:hypothetical protein